MSIIHYKPGPNNGGEVDNEHFKKVFNVLRDYLQNESSLSQNEAIDQVRAILPERKRNIPETEHFYIVALDLARQTPYKHPASQKLANMVSALIDTYDAEDPLTGSAYGPGEEFAADYYQTLLGDYAIGLYDDGYVNEQALSAQVFANANAWQSVPKEALSPFHRAFDEEGTATDANISAAALWMLNYGFKLYQASFESDDEIKERSGLAQQSSAPSHTHPQPTGKTRINRLMQKLRGDKSSTKDAAPAVSTKPDLERYLTSYRWSVWKQGFQQVAAGAERNGLLSSDCRELAAEAVRKMEELETQPSKSVESSTSSLVKEKKEVFSQ